MSEQSLARWHAIPMERPQAEEDTLKRARPDDGNDDDDDISLVSRSPSPTEAMEVDSHGGIYAYHSSYVAPEVVTVETKIKPTNKGFALLSKLGWAEGQPIGLSGEGRLDPVPFHVKTDSTGLGKLTQDYQMIEDTVSQRRVLDSERQRRENEEQRRKREEAVARKQAVDAEISETLRAFYCALCEKQFKTIAQYDEHTNSYAHHHKARLRDAQINMRLASQDDAEKRKEKERKREERELRKMAAAKGIKMPKTVGITAAPVVPTVQDPSSSMDVEPRSEAQPSASGSTSNVSGGTGAGFKKTGWATVGSASTPTPPSNTSPTPASSSSNQTPTFRNAGWSSLDTSAAPTAPPPPPSAPPPAPAPAPATSTGGWSKGGFASINEQNQLSRFSTPSSASTVAVPAVPSHTAVPSSLSPTAPPAPRPASNWQQFQKGVRRR